MAIKSRLLLIAQPNSYRIAPYINAAKRLGLDVIVASRGEYSLISEVYEGLHIDLDDHASALKSILHAPQIDTVIGVLGSDDSTVELAAKVAKSLSLPHNPVSASQLTQRKDLARAHLLRHHCSVPLHAVFDLTKPYKPQLKSLIISIPYPWVLKPLSLSASRGVIRVNNKKEFLQSTQRIKKILQDNASDYEQSHLLIEQYIDGAEVAFEGFLHNSELYELVIFDKPEPLTGPFFEETIYVTPSQHERDIQSKIKQSVAEACRAYGLTTGPIHAELRITQTDAFILEVASRTIGGDCARSLDSAGEFNLEELVVSLAIGKKITATPPANARGVMMIPIKQAGILRRVEGLAAARKVKYIDNVEIIIRQGNELIPLPEGNQYPGYIFAQAETPQQVINALKEAHEELNFVVAPAIKLTAI